MAADPSIRVNNQTIHKDEGLARCPRMESKEQASSERYLCIEQEGLT